MKIKQSFQGLVLGLFFYNTALFAASSGVSVVTPPNPKDSLPSIQQTTSTTQVNSVLKLVNVTMTLPKCPDQAEVFYTANALPENNHHYCKGKGLINHPGNYFCSPTFLASLKKGGQHFLPNINTDKEPKNGICLYMTASQCTCGAKLSGK